MREIKYKIWDIQKKKWLPSDVMAIINPIKKAFAIMVKDWEDYQEGEYAYPYLQKLVLFTSLQDKKGKDVYEGDIIEYCNGTKAKVIFKDGGFCGYDGYASDSEEAYLLLVDDSSPFEDGFEFEIIGDIYTNPELLKQRK
ncbi:MAG: hypothetical protein KAS32_09440 [Candidatus Peribacteraceae bacterium]|nr:hypothetical protein [Candidatus Peribacteraceae bacterium]